MIYLDSAATGFLKPDCVAEAVYKAMKELGNSGRGTNAQAMEASRAMYGTRRLLGEMFGCRANQVSFAANATEALNTAIYGTLFPGKEPVHVLTTAMEHNSVLRPLYRLEKLGLMLTVLPADGKGRISLKEMEAAIRPETKAIVCTHASNLTGNVNPIRAIGELAERHGLLFILDCAQTAGVLPVSMEKDHISILCASGHKGLMGPQGTGFLCVKEGVEVEPLKVGGSGTETFSHTHPAQMPEALEAGTQNGHGICGLRAALSWIKETGMDKIREKEQALFMRFYEQVREIPGIRLYGDFSPEGLGERTAVLALNIGEMDAGQAGTLLMEDYGIAVRTGGHCAPLMHQALGTEAQGAVRFSFSYFNTFEEIDKAALALREIAERQQDTGGVQDVQRNL